MIMIGVVYLKAKRKNIKFNSVGSLEKNHYTCSSFGCSNKMPTKGKCTQCQAKAISKRNKDYEVLKDKKKFGL